MSSPSTSDPTVAVPPSSPRVSVEQVTQWARKLYGMEAEVRQLESYADRNFLLRTQDGTGWVFKVSNRSESREILELQNAVLARLAEWMPTGSVPRVRPSLVGREVESVVAENGTHDARLVSYLDAPLLAQAENPTPQTWHSLGALLGRVAHGLSDFEHPAREREDFLWDSRRAAWTIGRTDLFEPQRRSLVEQFQLQFMGHVLPRLDRLPQGQIHGDANQHNMVVRATTPYTTSTGPEVVGLFDFGDTMWTARVFELAIAGAYAVLDHDEPLSVLTELVRGYHAHVPLESIELEALYPALCMRLVVSVTASTFAAHRDPDNDYITINQAPAWRTLASLRDVSHRQVEEALLLACGFGHESEPASLPRKLLFELRQRHVGPSLSLAYGRPLQIVRGRGAYLFDEEGRAFLDGVNNVCHVGHSHPRVVEAAALQMASLNTNTRYLHPNLARYAERLAALLPDPLDVCFFVNSGSEANELALRLARRATGRQDVVVVEHGYHGHTSSLVDLSHYKHAGPGGQGAPEWVHAVPCPDTYRGRYREDHARPAEAYAKHVSTAIETARAAGRDVAAFLAEPLIGCGGQIVPPDGWLRQAFAHARKAGAVCIADEVQVGFGRVGTHWWAFEEQGAVPDIVTLGKPIGNGHPMAAVVTTRAIADAFDDGMEFFSTFGGNPVSCAVGLAVLDVIEGEALHENALVVGNHLLKGLRLLADRYPVIGDVRGRGLYIGAELVRDSTRREPAADKLELLIEHARGVGCLLSSDGPDNNVLKIKPPLVFSRTDADLLLDVLEQALEAL